MTKQVKRGDIMVTTGKEYMGALCAIILRDKIIIRGESNAHIYINITSNTHTHTHTSINKFWF